jgi:hypothetical protein
VDNFFSLPRLSGNLFDEGVTMKLKRKSNPIWLAAIGLGLVVSYLLVNRPLPEYLVASADLASGTRVELAQVAPARLALDSIAGRYLRPEEFHSGLVLTRPILAGELIPASALSEVSNPAFTQLVVKPSTLPATQVRVGNRVAVWAATARDELAMPRLLVGAAEVTAIIAPEGLFSDALPSVQILISRTSVSALLQALAARQEIYLLPVS